MQEFYLNGAVMTDPQTTHRHLQQALSLPDYYGGNLDALWDCLVSDFSEKTVYFTNLPAMLDNLGAYGDALLELLWEAAASNSNLHLIIEDE